MRLNAVLCNLAASFLVLGASSSICGHADEKAATTTQFDGLWQTTLCCANASGALGYSFRFPSTVKNGVLHGEKGTAHEAGRLQIDGSLRADGTADLYVEGLVGAAPFAVGQRPAGTPYGYHVEARFSLDRAEGHRVEGRPCSVLWTREK
jgi:small ligand-binding sensory domain FIST